MSRPSPRPRHGFTLVELLVVIGIIALLISILLPSLSRARQAANVIDCQSRLRQMGQAIQLYVNENDGYAPYGWARRVHVGPGPNDFVDMTTDPAPWTYADTLTLMLGGAPSTVPGFGNTAERISPIFLDKDTLDVSGADDHRIVHYIGNPRVLIETGVGEPLKGWSEPMRQPRYATIKRSSEAMILWCAAQQTDGGDAGYPFNTGSATYPLSFSLDDWKIYWGHGYLYPAALQPEWTTWGFSYDDRIRIGGPPLTNTMSDLRQANVDSTDLFINAMRFRHMNNTTGNFLFGDGHVESRKLGEVRSKDVCVNPPA